MNKKRISILLIITLIISLISACNKTTSLAVPETQAINEDTPYYSITTQYAGHERNHYMDVDVKIPKITYSIEETDELFDSINEELYNKLSNAILTAENEAYDTYITYLSTAKNNVRVERENKLRALKTKYADVIGDKEITSINETIDALNQVARENEMATKSDIDIKPVPIGGFTGSETLVNPELHNKKIIIVETTESGTEQVTSSIEERPSGFNKIAPPENGERPNFPPRSSDSEFKKPEFPKKASDSEFKKIDLIVKASQSEVKKELTLADFYNDFKDILSIEIPNNRELTRAYTPTKITCNFDVKCLDEDYLSLFIELTVTKTAPSVKRYFYNVDLHKKKTIKIADVLGDNYKEIIVNSINKSIASMSEIKKQNLKANYSIENLINSETPFFINNNHMPVIELDKFTISNTYQEFQIIKY